MYYYREPVNENDRKASLCVFAAFRHFATVQLDFPIFEETKTIAMNKSLGNVCYVAQFFI